MGPGVECSCARSGVCTATSTIFLGGPFLTHVSRISQRLCHLARAERYTQLRAHASWVLIGACNPMKCPIQVVEADSSGTRVGPLLGASRFGMLGLAGLVWLGLAWLGLDFDRVSSVVSCA